MGDLPFPTVQTEQEAQILRKHFNQMIDEYLKERKRLKVGDK